MAVSPDDVRHVARLAGIEVDPSEIPGFARDLAAILAWVDALPATSGHGPTAEPVRLRDDTPVLTEATPLIDAAPDLRDGLIAVPRVLD